MKVQFRCPNADCRYDKTGYGWIEEIMVDVCQSSVVSDIESITDTLTAVDYGRCSYDGGHVDHYVCGHCGLILIDDERDIPITEEHELFKWLKDKGMLSDLK